MDVILLNLSMFLFGNYTLEMMNIVVVAVPPCWFASDNILKVRNLSMN